MAVKDPDHMTELAAHAGSGKPHSGYGNEERAHKPHLTRYLPLNN
jgi:hypothetical protein